MKWIRKIRDCSPQYAWAVLIAVGFALFMPDEAARLMGISEIREDHKGMWWIGVVLAAAIWSSKAFLYITEQASLWLELRRRETTKNQEALLRREQIESRLDSLDNIEQLWIQYCLYHNVQTVSAFSRDKVALSLCKKEILKAGSGGSTWDLSFHLPDEVWEHLKENKHRYVREADYKNPRFESLMTAFKEARYPS